MPVAERLLLPARRGAYFVFRYLFYAVYYEDVDTPPQRLLTFMLMRCHVCAARAAAFCHACLYAIDIIFARFAFTMPTLDNG